MKVRVLVIQSCLTFCDPMDSNLPGSSIPGILQARILEWVAISFSREILCHPHLTKKKYTEVQRVS